jgi:hypothetical protein
VAIDGVVYACQPKSAAGSTANAIKGKAGVVEDGDAVGVERGGDWFRTDGDVMIAEDGVELAAL